MPAMALPNGAQQIGLQTNQKLKVVQNNAMTMQTQPHTAAKRMRAQST